MSRVFAGFGGRRAGAWRAARAGRRKCISLRAAGATLLLAGLSVATIASPTGTPAQGGRSSVLLITLDTTRADHLGCYGDAAASTPSLDALARAGARFETALSPVPLTFPSHASLMTGKVPRHHGSRDNALFRLGKDVPVLAESLRAAGYGTFAFVSAAVLDREQGLSRGFDVYDDSVRVGDRSAFNYEERAASQTTEAVLARLGEIRPPFFLWVHYFDPHFPYVPPEPFRSRFKDRPYDGEVAFMDRELGRLLERVRGKGVSLLVVAAGDHGECLGEHGESTHGVFVYQATQRVPLILSGPGVPAGKVIGRTVGLVDVAPTILDLLGLPALGGADGRSLAPLLRGSKSDPPDYEMESFFGRFAFGWAPLRAIVRGNLKYVEAPRPELYDLSADPRENRNLAGTHGAQTRPLAAALGRLTAGDSPAPAAPDPRMAELRRRIESLGYVGGTGGGGEETAIDPKDGITLIGDLEAARRALQLGNPKDGIPLLERLLAKNPQNVHAMLTLARCHLASGDVDKAISLDRSAVAINPGNDIAHYNLANALAEKGRADLKAAAEAESEYDRALAIDPRQADVYLSYAAMLAAEHKQDETQRILERAREAGVQDPDIETELGLMLLLRGSQEEARASFARAVALNPRAGRALEALGRIAYSRNGFREAADYYARALAATPSSGLARTLGSIQLFKLGDREGAARAFRRALELATPGDPSIGDLRAILQDLEPRP